MKMLRGLFLLATVSLLTTTVLAQAYQLTVSRVEVDYSASMPTNIYIYGEHFGAGLPSVKLDGTALQVINNVGGRIVAHVPNTRSWDAGTYLLEVSIGNGIPKNGTFDVAIGTQGPTGVSGP